MVDLVVFWVVSTAPVGEEVVLLVSVRLLSVVMPLLSVVRLVVLSLDDGAGVAPEVEDQVDVVLEEEPCARATPDIVASTAAAASHVLIMWYPLGGCAQAEIACCPNSRNGARDPMSTGTETTQLPATIPRA